MKRKNYIARSTKPIKRSRVRATGKPSRRFRKHRCQPYLDWLKTQACVVTGRFAGQWEQSRRITDPPYVRIIVDPAHVKTRSTGGDDLWNALPLSHHLHEEQHAIGRVSFERKYGINMQKLAEESTERFLAEYPEYRPTDVVEYPA
jgi:hypothetical protein